MEKVKVVVKTNKANITISTDTAITENFIDIDQKELEQKEKELEKEIRERKENLRSLLIDYAGNEDDIRHIIEEAEYKIKKLEKELEEIRKIKETKRTNNNTNEIMDANKIIIDLQNKSAINTVTININNENIEISIKE
jgi:F0F1-type ATP synthase epsilon subunit